MPIQVQDEPAGFSMQPKKVKTGLSRRRCLPREMCVLGSCKEFR
jgi:hypothetical protein